MLQTLRLSLSCLVFTCFYCVMLPAGAQTTPLHHDLKISIDPETRQLRGKDTFRLNGKAPARFLLASELALKHLVINGKEVPVNKVRGEQSGGLRAWRLPVDDSRSSHQVRLTYSGRLTALDRALGHRQVLGGLPAMAGSAGSYLPAGSGWYPLLEDKTFTYTLALDLPEQQRGLVAGRLVDEQQSNGRYQARFEFDHPAEGIALMAGPYQIRETIERGLRLRTYFHPQIAGLAPDYLDSITGYLELYNAWIGDYPFTEFSVVSSPLPTGFGMPTLTYMGMEVLRLPFIRFGSLGHEILHNWWGNGVYVDWQSGNWSEGLTTFMADYAYKQREGPDAARDMRLSWLRDFAAIPEGQDQALEHFTSRSHSTSQIVGYHKTAFVFIMLRDKLGEQAFNEGLRRFWKDNQFRIAAWSDLQRAFEASSTEQLEQFFDQWITRKGAPRLTLEYAKVDPKSNLGSETYNIYFTLSQKSPAYHLRVPVVVETAEEEQQHIVELSKARADFKLEVDERPFSLSLDPDYRLFRYIDPQEIPPILRQVIVDPATVTVIAARNAAATDAGKVLAERMLDNPPRFLDASAQRDAVPSPLLLIGTDKDVNDYLQQHNLPAVPETLKGKGTARVWAESQPNGEVLVVISAADTQALQALTRPLPHYGKQSFLVFEGDQAIDHGIWLATGSKWNLKVDSSDN